MKNNIVAKFMKIEFPEIQSSALKERLEGSEGLVELLRADNYPFNDFLEPDGFSFEISGNEQSFRREREFLGAILVDSERKYGLKIHKNAISLSCFGYEAFEFMLDTFFQVIIKCFDSLKIKHFQRLSLRNINLFKHSENGFLDISDSKVWGSQNFDSLSKEDVRCSGAATRHEYMLIEKLQHIQIASSVVFKGHSYIPHNEWDLWNLKGNIPTIEEDEPQLLIDIGSSQLVTSELSEFNIEDVKKQMNELRFMVNNVYNDIVGVGL